MVKIPKNSLYLNMRYFWTLIFLVSSLSWGQQTYYSPYSIHLPTETIEKIPRVIKISEEMIRIESDAGNGLTDIQIMVVQSKELNIDDYTSFTYYQCTSEDGVFPSVVIIEENPSFIDVIQPSKTQGQEDVFRLVLEQYN